MFTPQFLLISVAAIILAIYLPALACPKKFRKAFKNYMSEKETVRLMGGFMLLLAMMFLSVHWKLTGDWMLMISIFGWLIFIKGVLFIWYPNLFKRIVKKWKLYNTDTGVAILSILAILLAIALIYIATEMFMMGEIVAG
jgi:small-conductance mechanosensitive channel